MSGLSIRLSFWLSIPGQVLATIYINYFLPAFFYEVL
jgi:hypothetical protein